MTTKKEQAQAAVNLFNQKHSIGSIIQYRNDKGEVKEAEIRAPAELTLEETPCVYVKGEYNAVHLTQVITK